MIFLHEHSDFVALIENLAKVRNIREPSLVEKDYWLMHALWGLQNLKLNFQLKGGTSLSKGYGCIHRFSEDIDIKIEPSENTCGFKVYTRKNHDEDKHRESRKRYFNWIRDFLNTRIPGIIEVRRDEAFDDRQKFRSGGIRLLYQSQFGMAPGLKDGILLELGFDRTAPNQPCLVTSWAYDEARKLEGLVLVDNRAPNVLCYEPKFTFVEKLQAVVRKFRVYKTGESEASLPANFIRHYYDLYQLIDRNDVQQFIGTDEYLAFKQERFGGDDIKISNSDALKLTNPIDRALFEKEYVRSKALYYKERPSLQDILDRIGRDIERL